LSFTRKKIKEINHLVIVLNYKVFVENFESVHTKDIKNVTLLLCGTGGHKTLRANG
jgi:hypothetical protein